MYLGPKGYTIPKSLLTAEQHHKIRDDLTIQPEKFGAGGAPAGAAMFPVYRESATKFFVPRHYGAKHFGEIPADQVRLPEGEDIHLTFAGRLKPEQEKAAQKFEEHLRTHAPGFGGGLLEVYCGWGKTAWFMYAIACILRKKTLFIVHKECLMTQVIERIEQFLPGARVGKIQGPVIDVEGKDIVVCMLQSLVQKTYDPAVFESFGVTVIDEVHHISSETFSQALFKVVTRHMIGLSATINRKDGTTHVIKVFIGDVFHSQPQKPCDAVVTIRAVTFKSADPEYNQVITDWRGNTQNSSMISKLCEFNPRTEFILRVLEDHVLREDVSAADAAAHKTRMDAAVAPCAGCRRTSAYPVRLRCCGRTTHCIMCLDAHTEEVEEPIMQLDEQGNLVNTGKTRTKTVQAPCPNCRKKKWTYEQSYVENPYLKPIHHTHTIIMAQNLNILNYMYRKIVSRNLASVGFYIGGMKEKDLRVTATQKQVILASYQMCSEGLDIPTLNTEFLITPKTDVIQILGRMLRAKHAVTSPTLYDFVDTHGSFQGQWAKRKKYYKSQGYRIVACDSGQYNGISSTPWRLLCTEVTGGGVQSCAAAAAATIDSDDDSAAVKNVEKLGIDNSVCYMAPMSKKK